MPLKINQIILYNKLYHTLSAVVGCKAASISSTLTVACLDWKKNRYSSAISTMDSLQINAQI
jgi:predicted DNA-binding ribbon-helix-helix protein